MNKLSQLFQQIRDPENGLVVFLDKVCGLPVTRHPGQMRWLKNSRKLINILRPGNRFGKSLIGGGKHLYHAFTKINMNGMYRTTEEWERLKYDTLNFGPGYEQAREVLRLARDIAEGNIFIPSEFQDEYGVTNKSLLKDWFIVNDKSESQTLPHIEFSSGTKLYGRSYDEMGASFKMKAIAYVSGDEVADIAELWAFTNGTLIPRGAQYKNFSIDYYGTPQSEGHDYMRMIEMAEEDMARPDWEKSGMFYVQKGSMYENPFLDRQTVESIEKIADETMRKQIIEGEYVETGDKYFGYERVRNAIDERIKLIDRGIPGRRYLVTVDFAGGESYWSDYTVIAVIDFTEEPYRVVHFRRFQGRDMPIPMQYKLVEEIFMNFKEGSMMTKLIIDSSALGGKNALVFLRHMNPIQFDFTSQRKAEMLATYKIAFDGGNSDVLKRKVKTMPDGMRLDENPDWGIIKFPNIPAIVSEHMNYKLEDEKIKKDTVMALGMAVHYLEMRRPKKSRRQMVAFDLLKYI